MTFKLPEEQKVTNFKSLSDLDDYKKFAFGKGMLNVAIALVLATAFQKVVSSICDNLIMPFLNYFISKTGNTWRELVITPTEGMDLEIGRLLGNFLDFLIISLSMYFIYVKLLGNLIKENEEVK